MRIALFAIFTSVILRNEILKYDVVIIGGGPSGCACALRLKDSGLKVALIDKYEFPRDKVCGDAIPGRAIKTLNSIDPQYAAAFKKFPAKCVTKKTSLFYKNKTITFSWVLEAYTCARYEFDNFLFSLVREYTKTDIFTSTQADLVSTTEDGISISIKGNNKKFETKLLIGADGAHSVAAKQLAAQTLDRKHHVGSVRAYFTGLANMDSLTTEIYFNKRFLPSYLWVFPLPGDTANVGFGMLSSEISKQKINIRKAIYEFIETSPVLKQKFKDAKHIGELEGFGLPLGSNIKTISGPHFMLCGDAASLIDPATGDGIGNAMLSGKLAAEQAVRCFKENNFSSAFIKSYDNTVIKALGKELKQHYQVQRILSAFPFLFDIIFFVSRSKLLKKLIKKQL